MYVVQIFTNIQKTYDSVDGAEIGRIMRKFKIQEERVTWLLLLLTAIELSLGGSSPYTSTDKTNKNKYT
jgi:hypothetical protein